MINQHLKYSLINNHHNVTHNTAALLHQLHHANKQQTFSHTHRSSLTMPAYTDSRYVRGDVICRAINYTIKNA